MAFCCSLYVAVVVLRPVYVRLPPVLPRSVYIPAHVPTCSYVFYDTTVHLLGLPVLLIYILFCLLRLLRVFCLTPFHVCFVCPSVCFFNSARLLFCFLVGTTSSTPALLKRRPCTLFSSLRIPSGGSLSRMPRYG